jgi:pyruvate formate lyase activating enzyme
MHEAAWWEPGSNGSVRCLLCPHGCVVAPGRRGRCGVRENQFGALRSLNRGLVTSLAIDPIEKKPLRRYLPGTTTLSAGSFGCNMHCAWCQNHRISHGMPAARALSAEEIVAMARQAGCPSVALTYNEPSVFYEWTLDVARAARHEELGVVLVTNGYINPGPLAELLPFMTAMNIDLKSFDEKKHRKWTGGELRHVMRTIETVARSDCHLEVTTLVVPGVSDDPGDIESQCRWLAGLNPGIPLHLTRYFPSWRASAPATSPDTLRLLAQIARKRLNDVYIGNV